MLSDKLGETFSGLGDLLRAAYVDPALKDSRVLVPAAVLSLAGLVLFIDYARMLLLRWKMVRFDSGLTCEQGFC
jgi:hypothetical protein